VREVRELIAQVSDTGELRTDIVAWLIANSIQSESLQHMALCQQEVQGIDQTDQKITRFLGVWRRQAFWDLLNSESPQENKAVCLVSRFFETPQGEEIERILSSSKTVVPVPKDPVKNPEAEVKMRLISIIKTLEAVGMPQRMIQEVLRQVQGSEQHHNTNISLRWACRGSCGFDRDCGANGGSFAAGNASNRYRGRGIFVIR